MTNEQLILCGQDALYLMSHALNSTAPDSKRVSGMDLTLLYEFCNLHSVSAAVCTALDSSGVFSSVDSSVAKLWHDALGKSIRKNMLLTAERKSIFTFFEENGIWYLPLKGSILHELYPSYGMRQMADNDILIDPIFRKTVKDYMIEKGYSCEVYNSGNHDVYTKPPVYNFEMHISLFGYEHGEILSSYYADIKNRLVLNEGSSFGYRFTEEDFYIYIVAHAYKHYENGGIGIRLLSDLYVCLTKKGSNLDKDYIAAELKKLGAYDFERTASSLAAKLLGRETQINLSKEEAKMLDFLLSSGAFGTFLNRSKSRLLRFADSSGSSPFVRLRYFLRRMCPPLEWYQYYVPFCYKHRWSIPFYFIFRSLRILLFRRYKLKAELEAVNTYEKQ